MQENTNIALQSTSITQKISDFIALTKPRLASLVVFSSVAGYFMADYSFSWGALLKLIFGGILVTGSSNGLNQILEKVQDGIMKRTQNRPLPQNRLTPKSAFIFSIVIGLVGLSFLYSINWICFLLGLIALFSYVVIYTPMKKVSPIAVLVGAFPGSVPPMIGYVAASGTFGLEPGVLFAVQFFWQFPHFWSIAWKLHDDYTLAGYKMLPSKEGRNKQSAWQILFYTFLMFPVTLLPWVAQMTGIWSAILATVLNLVFLVPAFQLYKTLEMKHATRLMFFSFLYLPILFIIYLADKI